MESTKKLLTKALEKSVQSISSWDLLSQESQSTQEGVDVSKALRDSYLNMCEGSKPSGRQNNTGICNMEKELMGNSSRNISRYLKHGESNRDLVNPNPKMVQDDVVVAEALGDKDLTMGNGKSTINEEFIALEGSDSMATRVNNPPLFDDQTLSTESMIDRRSGNLRGSSLYSQLWLRLMIIP